MPFLINIIIGLVLSFASTLLQQAFAPKPTEQARRTGTRGSAQIGGKVPQYFLVGTVGEPGKLEYQNAWGNDGEVPNAYLTSVYSFGDLPITDLVGLFVNGVRVTLTESGAVAQGYPITMSGDNGTRRLWWKFFDGSQSTADSYLVAKFGSDADRAWASDMIGVGVPYLITTALWSETLWTGFPSFVGEFQGVPLYDPREDTTAGGSGSQRWDDQSTWAFSDNSMVIIYNIERGIYYDGARVWGGSATEAQLPYDVWAAAMDACDELVTLDSGGTEKRFRAGLRINLNQRPADVIKELLIGCNGRIAHGSDGTIYALVGLPAAPDFAFTDADVLASEPLGSIPFPNLDSIINGATATYREPSQAWEDKETAPYLRTDLEAEDDGRQQIEGLDLGTTFSGTQAQRVIKAIIEEGRRFRTHVPALPPEYSQFRPLHVGAWTSERYGYVAKWFLITARTRSLGFVVFGLQEIDPTDHDWTPGTDEQPLSFAPVVTNRPAPQEVSGFYVEPAIQIDNDGVSRRPAIDVFWSSASTGVDVRAVRVSIYLNAAADPVADDPELGALAWEGDVPPERGSSRHTEAIMPNVYYVVVIRYISESGRATLESGMFAVRAPNVLLGSNDIALDLSNVAQDVLNQLGLKPRQLIESFKLLGTLLEESDRENFTKRETLFREITVELEGLEASFTEVIEVALGPGGAIALALESLYAAMGGNTAEVNVRWEAVAAPIGYSARYAIQAAVNDGTFRAATLFLDVPADPGDPTRIGFMAGQTVFFTSGGLPIALMDEDGFFRSANDAVVIDMFTGDFSFGL
jgi:hypothetical protein